MMINLKQLGFAYSQMSLCFDLEVAKAERLAIVGASGSGKSSLLNLLAGFIYADRGELWLDGKDHRHTPAHLRPVSMLFQENNLFPHLTLWQNIALGLHTHLKLSAPEQRQLEQVVQAVGLTDFLSAYPTSLSGGQKQRVALARCLLRDKPILLLDEPFSALDPLLRQEMLALLEQIWQQKQLTLLIVTHQPNELAGKVDRIVRVEQGRISSL